MRISRGEVFNRLRNICKEGFNFNLQIRFVLEKSKLIEKNYLNFSIDGDTKKMKWNERTNEIIRKLLNYKVW